MIYFIQPAELVGTDRYKIGCSSKPTLKRCLSYKMGTRYLCLMEDDHPFITEAHLKKAFNENFNRIAGAEYFEGSEKEMLKLFIEVAINNKEPENQKESEIEELNIFWNTDIKDDYLWGLPNLKKLRVNKNITDLGISHLTKLEEICLIGNYKITDRTLSTLPSLKNIIGRKIKA